MDQTTNLRLPYIAPSQAQKHVTHNQAIRALDALVQLSVLSRKLNSAPQEPLEGDRYIVASEAAAPWAGKTNQIGAWQDGAWAFFQPQEGWYAWVAEEHGFVVFNQTSWSEVKTGTNPVDSVGINTIADDNNRLALKSAAALFDHVGGGHQLKINKVDDSQAASVLFQSNYEGRAEMGTMWGRDFRIKTSADGDQWHDAMVVDSATGIVRFPSGVAHAATGKKQSSLIFLPETDGGRVIYQPLGVRTQVPKTAKLALTSAESRDLHHRYSRRILWPRYARSVDDPHLEYNQIACATSLRKMGHGSQPAASKQRR